MAPTVFVKDARYDKLMEAFGGVGVHATTPAELRKRAWRKRSPRGKPTLINAIIDETAGTESGRITSLNPQSAARRSKLRQQHYKENANEQQTTRRASRSSTSPTCRPARPARRCWPGSAPT